MTDTHIESLYQEARSALKARDYEYAIELLKRVLVVDENYKDTSRLLEKAIQLRKLRWYKNPILWGALGSVIIFVLGFLIAPRIRGLFASPAPIETFSPTATRTAAPTKTSIPTATPMPTASPTSTVTPLPSWVTDFSEPILTAIQDREPYFQDDFGPNSRGWSSAMNSPISIEEGVMRLKQGGFVDNIFLRRMPNYVFQLDIARPTSGSVKVIFSGDNEFIIDPMGWVVAGSACAQIDCVFHEQAFSQIIQLMIIVRGSQAGFYVAENPVFYFEDPNLADIGKYDVVYFRCDDSCEFDNVKFWDLDKVPNLP